MKPLHAITTVTEKYLWQCVFGQWGRRITGSGTAHIFRRARIATPPPMDGRGEWGQRRHWDPWEPIHGRDKLPLAMCKRIKTTSHDPYIQSAGTHIPRCPDCLRLGLDAMDGPQLAAFDPWYQIPQTIRHNTADPVTGL